MRCGRSGAMLSGSDASALTVDLASRIAVVDSPLSQQPNKLAEWPRLAHRVQDAAWHPPLKCGRFPRPGNIYSTPPGSVGNVMANSSRGKLLRLRRAGAHSVVLLGDQPSPPDRSGASSLDAQFGGASHPACRTAPRSNASGPGHSFGRDWLWVSSDEARSPSPSLMSRFLHHRNGASSSIARAISRSQRSPLARRRCLS